MNKGQSKVTRFCDGGVQTKSALGIKVCVELRLIAMYKGGCV